jgi:hypothetical protein
MRTCRCADFNPEDETEHSSQTYKSTWRYNSEDQHRQLYRCDSLKCHTFWHNLHNSVNLKSVLISHCDKLLSRTTCVQLREILIQIMVTLNCEIWIWCDLDRKKLREAETSILRAYLLVHPECLGQMGNTVFGVRYKLNETHLRDLATEIQLSIFTYEEQLVLSSSTLSNKIVIPSIDLLLLVAPLTHVLKLRLT